MSHDDKAGRQPPPYTTHAVCMSDARDMSGIKDDSVSLIVTSPPYPMIGMWDEQFSHANQHIGKHLSVENADSAFRLMHEILDDVWRECYRVLQPGGLACINIGDATRKIGGEFRLFSNHSRILHALMELGFSTLPDILWHKPTNAPNKFLGSGMLPSCAYVTYEHEYILIARKGGLRRFSDTEQPLRRLSAFFMEERNVWFSDFWKGINGAHQRIRKSEKNGIARLRSAAYPLILPYRLILMHSIMGDTVLDPFLGTGTTTAAAIACGRSSIGFEIERGLEDIIYESIEEAVDHHGYSLNKRRLDDHRRYVEDDEIGRLHTNYHDLYQFPVATKHEEEIRLIVPVSLEQSEGGEFVVEHELARACR